MNKIDEKYFKKACFLAIHNQIIEYLKDSFLKQNKWQQDKNIEYVAEYYAKLRLILLPDSEILKKRIKDAILEEIRFVSFANIEDLDSQDSQTVIKSFFDIIHKTAMGVIDKC